MFRYQQVDVLRGSWKTVDTQRESPTQSVGNAIRIQGNYQTEHFVDQIHLLLPVSGLYNNPNRHRCLAN